jgi:hypothetical protein
MKAYGGVEIYIHVLEENILGEERVLLFVWLSMGPFSREILFSHTVSSFPPFSINYNISKFKEHCKITYKLT